jgi:hypothetical protein
VKYILNPENQEKFLLEFTSNIDSDNEEIKNLCHGCYYYEFEVHVNSYFLSKSILRTIRRDKKYSIDLSMLFKLLEETSLCIEQIDSDFIQFLLSGHSKEQQELDMELLQVLENYVRRHE